LVSRKTNPEAIGFYVDAATGVQRGFVGTRVPSRARSVS
jgi:hypothetical protein